MPKRKPGLYKVGATWYINFTDPVSGKQRRYSTKTSDETRARELLDKDRAKAWDRKNLGTSIDWNVRQLIDWTWTNHWSVKPKANREATETALKAVLDRFGDTPVSDITPEDYRKFRAKRELAVKFSTTNRELTYLKFAIHRAMDEGYLTADPLLVVKQRSEKRLKRDRNATIAEQNLLAEQATGRLAQLIEFALASGLREGEMLKATPKDIDHDRGVMLVVSDKGGDTIKRWVEITPRMAAVLEKLNLSGPLLFPDRHGHQIKKDSLVQAFRRLCDSLKIENLHFHDLRHTFATDYWRRTRDIVKLMNILGHQKVETTMTYINIKVTDIMPAAPTVLSQIYHTKSDEVAETSETR